jgi:peptidoglycan/LPS O-acetylase OafA/YrhL
MPHNDGGRLVWLDGLRGVASVSVAIFHYGMQFDVMYPPARPDMGWDLLFTAYGVHVFFAVSGFVIAHSLRRAPTATAFVVGRFTRLWPAFGVCVVLTALGLWAAGSPVAPSVPQLAVNLTMLAGFLGVPYVDGVYWTLTLELLFYAWMLGLHRAGALRRPELAVVVWTGLHALHMNVLLPMGLGSDVVRELCFEEGLFYFLTGVLLERWTEGVTPRRVLALVWVLALSGWVQGAHELVVNAVTAGILALGVAGRAEFLRARVLVWLGAVSYPLYLLHQELGYLVIAAGRDLGLPSWPVVAVTLAAALALSDVVSRLVERPAMTGLRTAAARAGLLDR